MVLLLPGGEGVPPKPTMATPPPSQSHAKAFGGNSVDDAIAVARDGIKHAGQLFQNAGERAARASDSELEEPIWKAIRENFSGERFHNMHPLKKGALLFLIVVLFLWYSNTVFSIAFPLLFCYIIYYAIWATWLKGDGKSGASPAGKQVAGNAAPSVDEHTIAWPAKDSVAEARAERARHMARRRVRPSWRDRANRDLAAKPLREKISELLGSMLLAALFAIVAACIAPLVLASQPGSERLATYLWLATVGTLGSWAVLVPSKFVEGKLEDHVPLRIALLSLGALVGLAGWFIGDMLLLKSPGWGEPVDVHHGLLSHELLGWPASSEGANPSPAVYLSYFAFLFLLPRWWRQTECTRSSRLSLWWVFAAVGWAWLLHIFWWFPQPTGLMAAGVIATATQLASPWMPPSRRRALAAEIDEGVVQA
jgi:hypothetical protein